MADQDFDLTEEATPHKLQKAREEGSVAKSPELSALAILVTMAGTLYAIGWDRLVLSIRLQQSILGHINRTQWTVDGISTWIGQLAVSGLHILSPLLMAVAIAAVLINLVQTGPIFSLSPLSPDLNRISPATGFKRIFSMRIVYESGKSVVKLGILSCVAYFAIAHTVPGLVALSAIDPKGYAKLLVEITAGVLMKMIFALFVIALIDTVYTRWEFAKRMRMSRRDLRDESKQREGDPRIRSRVRQLRQEMLRRSKAMTNLPAADVLITNPTRIAVALSYKHGESGAPQVLAKGAGELARKMREVAARHRIPVVQNKSLARGLFRDVDYEGFVPEKWYPQVAKIMVWVYVMRQAKQSAVKTA